jgi:hypothetical protein
LDAIGSWRSVFRPSTGADGACCVGDSLDVTCDHGVDRTAHQAPDAQASAGTDELQRLFCVAAALVSPQQDLAASFMFISHL